MTRGDLFMIHDELKPAPTSLIEQLQAARNHLLADLDGDRAADARDAAAGASGASDPRSHRNDADEHLRQLCAALALGDLRPFAAYVQWMRSVPAIPAVYGQARLSPARLLVDNGRA